MYGGDIAEAFCGVPESMKQKCRKRLTPEPAEILCEWESTDFEGWEQMVKTAADLRFSAEGAAPREKTEPPSTL